MYRSRQKNRASPFYPSLPKGGRRKYERNKKNERRYRLARRNGGPMKRGSSSIGSYLYFGAREIDEYVSRRKKKKRKKKKKPERERESILYRDVIMGSPLSPSGTETPAKLLLSPSLSLSLVLSTRYDFNRAHDTNKARDIDRRMIKERKDFHRSRNRPLLETCSAFESTKSRRTSARPSGTGGGGGGGEGREKGRDDRLPEAPAD